jgi:hypothetical protein
MPSLHLVLLYILSRFFSFSYLIRTPPSLSSEAAFSHLRRSSPSLGFSSYAAIPYTPVPSFSPCEAQGCREWGEARDRAFAVGNQRRSSHAKRRLLRLDEIGKALASLGNGEKQERSESLSHVKPRQS